MLSLEMLTKRGTPKRTAASMRWNVDMRFVCSTTCAGLPVGCGIAATCTTASIPATTAKAAPWSVRSAIT
jgi:hypothetical protein